MSRKNCFHAWISLGGNLGDVMDAMAYALQRFDHHADCSAVAVSSVYKTLPWGKTDQPWFLNACAKLSTAMEPKALLQLCLDIEEEMQRKRIEKWGPRTLDIDLLFYENLKISIPGRLILPHPEISKRAFVLIPLAEISPDLTLDRQTVANLAEKFEDQQLVKLPYGKLWWKNKLSGYSDTIKTKKT